MPEKKRRKPVYPQWDGARVRALRQHMGLTQEQLAEELGTRQQTVSEWEIGMYRPRGTSARMLQVVAEQARFQYSPRSEPEERDHRQD